MSGGAAGPVAADVGHRVERIVVDGQAAGERRQVDVHLWYPADPADAATRSKTVYRSALYGSPLPDELEPSWSVEAEIAREGAALDPSGGPYAPIVFSHGSSNDPFDYAHTLEAIADAGFIVVAPAHTNNTQDDVRRDYINALNGSRLLDCQDGLDRETNPTLNNGFPSADCSKTAGSGNVPNSMSDRARDVSATLDALDGWFGNDVDAERAGVMGHSRGTVTALAAAGGASPWGTADANCFPQQAPPDGLCWRGVNREPQVKAIMGMAIGAQPIIRGVNLAAITSPTLLVAGAKDINTRPVNSEFARDAIPDTTDKRYVKIDGATHRSFDSTYCAQLQSAGAAFDANHDGTVSAAEAAATNRPLDRWSVPLIASSFPGSISGKAVQYCAPEIFTTPVNIKRLVASIPNAEYACPDADTTDTCSWIPHISGPLVQDGVCTAANTAPPCTGVNSDAVQTRITEMAVEFFGTRLYGTTPPVLSVPADFTKDATGPAGATVSYTAGATDDIDPTPIVTCTPASGSVFAIGSTTVTCVATDNGGNTSSASFTVTVLGAGQQLSNLVADIVAASNLPPRVKSQLTTALRSLLSGFDPARPLHRAAACVTLRAFTTVVRFLAPAHAAEWTADANRIRAVLAC